MIRRFSGFRGAFGGMGLRAFLSLTLAIGMIGYGSNSLAQVLVSESGNPNQKPATGPKEFKHTVVTSQMSDGAQTSPAALAVKRGGTPSAGVDVRSILLGKSAVSTPLWQGLSNLGQSDRENASIRLEADSRCSSTELDLSKKAEALWNRGKFEAAIDALRSLESAGGRFAVGINWKSPKESSASLQVSTGEATAVRDSGDVRIGTRTGISKSTLDFDAQNGNLFAVLKYTDGSGGHWSVNVSTNGGLSWLETYAYTDPVAVKDISAAVVGDYLYVAYVVGTSPNEARIRRQFVFSGGTDGDFSLKTVFNKDTAINEISLISNADGYDHRLYYFAILADHKLIHYWAYNVNTPTPVWNERLTGVLNAGAGLSATFNNNAPSGYGVFASYIASDGTLPVMVWRSADSTWGAVEVLAQYSGGSKPTSISACNDTVICAFEHNYATGPGIRCPISYNGGGVWSDIVFQPPPGHNYRCPDVTARGGKGTAFIFSEEAGQFDFVWFRFRAGYQPGPWNEAVQINQFDVLIGAMRRIQWLPPRTRGGSSYGAIYLGLYGTPYFTRIDQGSAMSWLMLLLE